MNDSKLRVILRSLKAFRISVTEAAEQIQKLEREGQTLINNQRIK